MPVLDAAARADTVRVFVRSYLVGLGQTADLDSIELRTLVDDLDAWLDANQAAANTAITASVRSKAANTTKFAALAWVALKRAGAI